MRYDDRSYEDEEEQEEKPVVDCNIAIVVIKVELYRYLKGKVFKDKELLSTYRRVADAQDDMRRFYKEFRGKHDTTTDHWLIRFVDSTGLDHYQKWNYDCENMIAYNGEYARQVFDRIEHKPGYHPTFMIDRPIE